MVKEYIYVLALEQGKYYVGHTTNVQRRWNEHRSGQGSTWTRLYPPIDMEEHYEVPHGRNVGMEEDLKVKEMMQTHGMDHVRGGSFCNIQFTASQTEELNRSRRQAEELCFRCGSKDHVAAQCNAAIQVTNNRPSKRRKLCDKAPRGQSSRACERCGRDSRTADHCYAGRGVARFVLHEVMYESDSSCESVCERCGRDSHTADQCYAVRDVAGNVIRRRNCR